MAAFNFPDPTVQQTVTNPITGSTYQWKEPPGKWVITTKVRAVTEIIYEGDTPPTPRGDYKLWYSTDTLELYFWYEDANGNGAWVPTAAPITALEELTAFAAQAEVDIDQLQYKQQLLQVALDDIYLNQQQQQGDYVSKVGGDEMQGPFKVLTNPDIPGSRDSRRIETYGVFSGTDTTALRLGTNRDRIYVGHDDTSFNGLVKIDRIAEKNAGNSVKFENDIKMGIHQIKNLAEATDDKDAVNYGQVKEELEELRDKIVGEVSIGTWKFDNVSSGVTPLTGCFITKKDSNPPQISPNDINVIRISDEDVNGNPGVFDWEIGDLLTFTNVNNTAQSIKFRVNSAPANSGSYWIVSVAHLTSNYDFFQNAEYYLSHIHIDVSVDVDALDDTYLRLDCANDPLKSELDLSSHGLQNASYVQFINGGLIKHNNTNKITFKDASDATTGSGLVQFERPSSDQRRGVTIRGKNTDNNDDDLLYTYTFPIGGDAIGYKGRILNDNHITNKKYVDDKIEELLAKIEELEMAGGTPPESYYFRMTTKSYSSSAIGYYINSNEICSTDYDGDSWEGRNTYNLTSERMHMYICFPDGWQLNPTGHMQVVENTSSTQYDREGKLATYSISEVEVCPPDKSQGKNIYRARIQVDGLKEAYNSFLPSWSGDTSLSITFTGGSVTKVS